MDRECAVESNGSRRAVPDEIMNSSAPLHCLKRDIAQRVHAKVQGEIAKHDEASCKPEPPNRHLIAENSGNWHLNVVLNVVAPCVGTPQQPAAFAVAERALANDHTSISPSSVINSHVLWIIPCRARYPTTRLNEKLSPAAHSSFIC